MSHSPAPFDRAPELRGQAEIVAQLRSDERTAVVVVREGRVRVRPPVGEGQTPALITVSPAEVGDAQWALLGRRSDGTALLLAATEPEEGSIDAAPAESWLGLRDLGGIVDRETAETVITAVALASWLRDIRFCGRCAAPLRLRQAGWSRRCPGCSREHFPRTDPAVIVAVESADGERLLLGANAQWHGRMYSCFAGFVEAGESLETTVHREIAEEAGVRLSDLRYRSSQPWPYPHSLMIGFRATAADAPAARPDGEEIVEVRWFTRAEIRSALAGEGPVGLPGAASLAHSLIWDWAEERG